MRAIARSDHWRWVSTPRWARTSRKVTSSCPSVQAQDEPGEDLQRIGSEVSAEHGLGGEPLYGVADEDPADGNRRVTSVVPHGGAREELNRSVALTVPAGKGLIPPWCRRVAGIGAQVGQPGSYHARSPDLLRRMRRGRRAQVCIQAQARDDRCHTAYGCQQLQGGVGAIADDDELSIRLPAMPGDARGG